MDTWQVGGVTISPEVMRGWLTAHLGGTVDPPWPSFSFQQNLRKEVKGQCLRPASYYQRLLLEFSSENLTMGTLGQKGT